MKTVLSLLCLMAFTGCTSKCEKLCRCQISREYKEGPKKMMGAPAANAEVNKKMKVCVSACEKNPDASCKADKECC